MIKAQIIAIGDELLIGQVVNTNASWIAEQLDVAGVKVLRMSEISDNENAIVEELERALEIADVVILTGGLGPTKDDLTKKVLAGFFDMELVLNEEMLEIIRNYFSQKGKPLSELNRGQAMLPEGCVALPNFNGTAPGMWFDVEGGMVVVSLPGVPHEMKPLMENQVLSRLKEKFRMPVIVHKTVLTQGIAESFLADEINDWEAQLPENIKLAYLPSTGMVRLRLSCTGSNRKEISKQVEGQVEKLLAVIEDYVFGFDKDTLQLLLGKELLKLGAQVAMAESCTGGYVSHLITSVPGSSKYFVGGAVVYSNLMKQELLGVRKETLENFGAVSKEVAEEMVAGCLEKFSADFAAAITGIAGPEGGTEEKPVGTVWISVASAKGTVVSEKFLFGKNRERNIMQSAYAALHLLLKMVKKKVFE